jgi:hypothetical protein
LGGAPHELVRCTRLRTEELEEDLCKESWELQLRINVQSSSVFDSAPSYLNVSFPDPSKMSTEHATLPILIHRDFGVEAVKEVHFGTVSQSQTRDRRLLIRSLDGKPFRIMALESDAAYLRAKSHFSTARESHWLDISFIGQEPGNHQHSLSVHTDHPDAGRLRIQIFALVTATSPGS